MKNFLKLNLASIIYALMVFVPTELMLNVYRISRLLNWDIGTVNILTLVVIIIEVIGGTFLLVFLTKKWLGDRLSKFWTIFLWVPYFVLFIYIFASMFPITYGGDAPNPGSGLMIIGGLLIYPFYILIVNSFSATSDEKEVSAP